MNALVSSRRLALLFATILSLFAVSAWACGGCFSPPGPNLVVQDAERILFVRDAAGKTTVTVEVRYSGPADNFAWVLPLPKLPKVGVGTTYVFDRLDQATAPRFVTTRQFDTEGCDFGDSSASIGCGAASADSSGATAFPGGAFSQDIDGKNGVVVLEKNQAGPYDYQIIQGNDGAGLLKWLNDNGFDTPSTALPILQSHAAKGDVFVAFKLSSGADVAEIRPVVLEMQDADPCVPLRLTSIAAADELAVIVYTLGPGRAVPKNHLAVTPNPLRLRWDGGVENYVQVVAAAIDEAAGRAFVPEFAGPASSVQVRETTSNFGSDTTVLYGKTVTRSDFLQVGEDVPTGAQFNDNGQRSVWQSGALFDKKRFSTAGLKDLKTAAAFASWLEAGGFAVVAETAAMFEDATGLATANGRGADVLAFWVEVRAGVVDFDTLKNGGAAFDAGKLATDLEVGIVEPIFVVADALADSKMTLSRLHMRISADEMDRDPIFAFNATLPDVNVEWGAQLSDVCDRNPDTFDAMRMRMIGGPLEGGSWILAGRTLDFSANSAASRSTFLGVATTLDERWQDAPAALRIDVLDETGEARAVPPSKVEVVDTAILAAQPGVPNLAASFDLAPAAGEQSVWAAPDNDPHASLRRVAEQGQADTGGCTGGRGKGPIAGYLVLALLAVAALLGSRRLRRN